MIVWYSFPESAIGLSCNLLSQCCVRATFQCHNAYSFQGKQLNGLWILS